MFVSNLKSDYYALAMFLVKEVFSAEVYARPENCDAGPQTVPEFQLFREAFPPKTTLVLYFGCWYRSVFIPIRQVCFLVLDPRQPRQSLRGLANLFERVKQSVSRGILCELHSLQRASVGGPSRMHSGNEKVRWHGVCQQHWKPMILGIQKCFNFLALSPSQTWMFLSARYHGVRKQFEGVSCAQVDRNIITPEATVVASKKQTTAQTLEVCTRGSSARRDQKTRRKCWFVSKIIFGNHTFWFLSQIYWH